MITRKTFYVDWVNVTKILDLVYGTVPFFSFTLFYWLTILVHMVYIAQATAIEFNKHKICWASNDKNPMTKKKKQKEYWSRRLCKEKNDKNLCVCTVQYYIFIHIRPCDGIKFSDRYTRKIFSIFRNFFILSFVFFFLIFSQHKLSLSKTCKRKKFHILYNFLLLSSSSS